MNLDYDVSQDFPFKDVVYLNNASTSLMPISSIKAMTDFLVSYNEMGPDSKKADNYVTEKFFLARKAISYLINLPFYLEKDDFIVTHALAISEDFIFSKKKNIYI